MKTYPRIMRRDAAEEHVHALPDGHKTLGSLLKPSQSELLPMHTHLYEHEGVTHETGVAPDEPGHTHESVLGDTSGPQKVPAQENFGVKNDSAFRIGREWVVRNDSGIVIARGDTAAEAEERAKRVSCA